MALGASGPLGLINQILSLGPVLKASGFWGFQHGPKKGSASGEEAHDSPDARSRGRKFGGRSYHLGPLPLPLGPLFSGPLDLPLLLPLAPGEKCSGPPSENWN